MVLLAYEERIRNHTYIPGSVEPTLDVKVEERAFNPPPTMRKVKPAKSRVKVELRTYQQLSLAEKVPYIVRNAVYWPALLAEVMQKDYESLTVRGQEKASTEKHRHEWAKAMARRQRKVEKKKAEKKKQKRGEESGEDEKSRGEESGEEEKNRGEDEEGLYRNRGLMPGVGGLASRFCLGLDLAMGKFGHYASAQLGWLCLARLLGETWSPPPSQIPSSP